MNCIKTSEALILPLGRSFSTLWLLISADPKPSKDPSNVPKLDLENGKDPSSSHFYLFFSFYYIIHHIYYYFLSIFFLFTPIHSTEWTFIFFQCQVTAKYFEECTIVHVHECNCKELSKSNTTSTP